MRDLVLTTIRGLTDPESVPLKPDRPVTIGRAGALKIHDELVSIHHARVFFDEPGDRWVVRDLDSSSGTFVDRECIRDDVRPIRPGTELRFGNVVVRVERASRSTWRVVAAVAAGLGLFGLSAVCCAGLARRNQSEALEVDADAPVRSHERSTQRVVVPPEWLRRHGLPWSVRVLDVTDQDHDDISELWLQVGRELAIVTFGPEGRWVDLGLTPYPYQPVGEPGGQYAVLEAGGETWQFDPASGRYHPIKQDGIVVWYREERPTKPEPAAAGKAKAGKAHGPTDAVTAEPPRNLFGQPKPLKVARIPLKDSEQLGQFFVDRGIYGQVHYLICEGAFEGIRAQAVTTDGQVHVPNPGCIDGLRLDTASPTGFGGRPYAIALSPAGARALIDDVTTFYAGDPSGVFLSPEDRQKVAVFVERPGILYTGTRLLAGDGQVVIADPFPAGDARLPDAPRILEPAGRMYEPSPPAETVVVSEPGSVEVQAEGRRFRVVADDDLSITVEELSSGTPVDVCMAPTKVSRSCAVDGLEVKIDVLRYQPLGEDRIQRIRVGFRAIR